MFYYYGRKKQIAKFYPRSNKDTIIEPFAGSAAYALHGDNWEKNVILIEKNEGVVKVWEYLINATVEDIHKLPDLKEGDLLDNFNLSFAEKLLISFHIRPGAVSMRNKVGRFSRWGAGKKYIIENLHKIKHWKIIHGDYKDAPIIDATYFIDPPYKQAGKHYINKSLNYLELAEWVNNLPGQVIACEGENHGEYLPFKELPCVVNNGGMNLSKKSKEYMWIK